MGNGEYTYYKPGTYFLETAYLSDSGIEPDKDGLWNPVNWSELIFKPEI